MISHWYCGGTVETSTFPLTSPTPAALKTPVTWPPPRLITWTNGSVPPVATSLSAIVMVGLFDATEAVIGSVVALIAATSPAAIVCRVRSAGAVVDGTVYVYGLPSTVTVQTSPADHPPVESLPKSVNTDL